MNVHLQAVRFGMVVLCCCLADSKRAGPCAAGFGRATVGAQACQEVGNAEWQSK